MKCGNKACDGYDENEIDNCEASDTHKAEDCYDYKPLTTQKDAVADVPLECRVMDDLGKAAQSLFDNRLGWADGKPPHAPRSFWADLGAALYGEDDPRVKELREEARP